MFDIKKPSHFIYALAGLSLLIGFIIALFVITNNGDEKDFEQNDPNNTYTITTNEAQYDVKYSNTEKKYYVTYKEGEVNLDELNELLREKIGNYEGQVVYDIPGAAIERESTKELTLEEEIQKARQERINNEKLQENPPHDE